MYICIKEYVINSYNVTIPKNEIVKILFNHDDNGISNIDLYFNNKNYNIIANNSIFEYFMNLNKFRNIQLEKLINS